MKRYRLQYHSSTIVGEICGQCLDGLSLSWREVETQVVDDVRGLTDQTRLVAGLTSPYSKFVARFPLGLNVCVSILVASIFLLGLLTK